MAPGTHDDLRTQIACMQAIQHRRARGRAERAKYCSGMEAPFQHMQRVRHHPRAPHRLVTRCDGEQHMRLARAKLGTDRQHRGNHTATGMAHGLVMRIVELVAMRSRAVHQCRHAGSRAVVCPQDGRGARAGKTACPPGEFARPGQRGAALRHAEVIQQKATDLLDIVPGESAIRQCDDLCGERAGHVDRGLCRMHLVHDCLRA